MVISDRPTVFTRVCPRCSQQIAGWITNENGFVSCCMCGYVIRDCGYQGSDFKGLFKQFEGKVIPSETLPKWETDRKYLFDHCGLRLITLNMEKCCNSHAGQKITACGQCRELYDRLADKLYDGKYINYTEMCAILRFVNGISKSTWWSAATLVLSASLLKLPNSVITSLTASRDNPSFSAISSWVYDNSTSEVYDNY